MSDEAVDRWLDGADDPEGLRALLADPARRADLQAALLLAARLRGVAGGPPGDPLGALLDGRLDAAGVLRLLLAVRGDAALRRDLRQRLLQEARLAQVARRIPMTSRPQERTPLPEASGDGI